MAPQPNRRHALVPAAFGRAAAEALTRLEAAGWRDVLQLDLGRQGWFNRRRQAHGYLLNSVQNLEDVGPSRNLLSTDTYLLSDWQIAIRTAKAAHEGASWVFFDAEYFEADENAAERPLVLLGR